VEVPLQLAIMYSAVDKTGIPRQYLIGIFPFYLPNLLNINLDFTSPIGQSIINDYKKIIKLLIANLTIEQINAKIIKEILVTRCCTSFKF